MAKLEALDSFVAMVTGSLSKPRQMHLDALYGAALRMAGNREARPASSNT